MSVPFLLLTEEHVRSLVSAQELVPRMERALAAFSSGEAVQPARTTLWVGQDRDFFGVMPAHLPGAALGTKLITLFSGNRARGLPSHFATVVLLDECTGALRAVMDGGYLTKVRTAAVSAVAVKHLSSCPVSRIGIFGCGVQARGHLEALATLYPSLREVRVWSPFDDERRTFAKEMDNPAGPRVFEAANGEDAARDADVIITVTSSPTPVLERGWVKSGALVVAVGACRPEHRELDPLLVASSRLVVDSREAALVESGDVMQAIAEGRIRATDVRAELGEIVGGSAPPRARPADVVIFKSLGLAVEDVAAAHLVYQLAVERGVGTELAV
ncbi:MAG: ornithine cyclodeaminase family protein [Bacteroidales bacterium]